MTYFKLGDGKYAVAQSNGVSGHPSLTIRRLPKPEETATVLEPVDLPLEDFDLVIDVFTPDAAAVLLTVARQIAFIHGLEA